MKKLTNSLGYVCPETNFIDMTPMSVLCQSGEGVSFGVTLEEMTENDSFTF